MTAVDEGEKQELEAELVRLRAELEKAKKERQEEQERRNEQDRERIELERRTEHETIKDLFSSIVEEVYLSNSGQPITLEQTKTAF